MIMERLKNVTNDYFIYFLAFGFIFVILNMVSLFWSDNDMYFLLATGREIIENGILRENPFFVLEGYHVVIQQWLSTVILYFLYNQFGNWGLMILSVVMAAIDGILIYKIGMIDKTHKKNTVILLTGLILLFLVPFCNVRPTLYTITLLLLQLYCCDKYEQTNNSKWLLSLPIISFLEINLHGSLWIIHFIFLIPYVVPAIKNPFVKFNDQGTYFRFKLGFFIVILLMILAGFLNPYGLDNIMFLFNTYGEDLQDISEIQPLSVSDFYGIVLIALVVIVSVIASKRSVRSTSFYLFCGTLLMAIPHTRNVVYLVIGSILMLMDTLSLKEIKLPEKTNKHTAKLMAVAFVLIILLTGNNLVQNAYLEVEDNATTPVAAVNYLNEHVEESSRSKTKVYTGFNNGGYFEFNGYRTYMEARPDLFNKKINKKEDIYKEYKELEKTNDDYEGFLNKYQFNYLVTYKSTMFDYAISKKDNYKCVVNEEEYRLWERMYW